MTDWLEPLSPFEWGALAYCAPRGIPLSVFMGRVVYPGDPQWEERDRWAAMEWLVEDRTRCSGCGFPRDECMATESPEYMVEATRCKACEARDASMREFQEGGGSASGMYFTIRKGADGDVQHAGAAGSKT